MKLGTPFCCLSISGFSMSCKCCVMYSLPAGLRNVDSGTARAGSSTVPFGWITIFSVGWLPGFCAFESVGKPVRPQMHAIVMTTDVDLNSDIFPHRYFQNSDAHLRSEGACNALK